MRAIIHGSRLSDRDLAGRTLRALRLFGVSAPEAIHEPWPGLLARIRAAPGPVWLIRAGAFPVTPFTEPPPSATGRPLVALGQVHPAEGGAASARGAWPDGPGFPASSPPSSAWLDARVAGSLGEASDLDAALRAAVLATGARVVAFPPLDVRDDPGLRIAEVVTSAQQGGAERIAIDLARGLRDHRLGSRLVLLGRPTRAAFDLPSDVIDLSRLGGPDPEHRARRVARRLVTEGFDLVHGHLLDEVTVRAFAARGLPMALTIHNTSASWPAGTRRLRARDVHLLIGCAQAVERELADLVPAIPARTVWNGVDFRAFPADAEVLARARAFREGLGFGADDFVLLSIANPRPQKRLHLLPAILRATRDALEARGLGQRARLVIAGAPARSPQGERAMRELEQAIDVSRVGEDVRLVGSTSDVAACLHGSDVLISTSAHEGLSLAQIEALAAGRPVVTTNVGGASEIAAGNPAVHLIDREAAPGDFASVLADLASRPATSGVEPARRHFDLARMVEGYARLLPRALRRATRAGAGKGVWLVTNNFSTGGAQTSARRLLLGLRERGIEARAAVAEEQPAFATPGRRSLIEAGVHVLALPDPSFTDASDAAALLIEAMDLDPPQSVLFWNLRPDFKLLIADALVDVPIFDVSPGEMLFSSFERHFARPRAGLPYRTFHDYGRRLAGVIVKYEAERERAERLLRAPVFVIPNGVPREDEERGSPPARGTLVIGTAARLDPRKHVDRLLRALRLAHDRLPPYVLRIAGEEEPGAPGHADELRSLARSLPVEFVGELDDTRGFLRELDLFVLVAEPAGCPNASLEAMAQALPVIATDVGGMGEQVADGVTGRLVGREDEAALAAALVELGTDPPLRAAMGAAGRERARQRFRLETMIDGYASVCLGPGPLLAGASGVRYVR